MYYVAKVYTHAKPLIVEVFDELKDAQEYVSLLTRTNKGKFVVLTCIR